LPDAVFGLPWNADLVHQVVTSLQSNQRQVTAKTKDRAEVRGGGKKPWQQKGTGRARHGSIRSPIWKGGGVTHGPLTEKNFKKKINKKMARRALYAVLSAKARDKELVVLDEVRLNQPKTKEAALMFSALAKTKDFSGIVKKKNGALLLLEKQNPVIKRAVRNLPYVKLDEARSANVLEVLQYKYVLFTKESVAQLT
ncbi:50S ribosomal protein L4, partial [Patescibacteria group bacterium]|nr:50S ribosomal protein L4 [Patescibacteria group bacterium]